MTGRIAYDYALVRAVPHVGVGDGETVAVVLQARQARFLGVRVCPATDAVCGRWPGLDRALLDRYLGAFVRLAEGDGGGHPVGRLPPSERFHWLVATRSTVLQPAPVRTGMTADPAAELDGLAAAVWGRGETGPVRI